MEFGGAQGPITCIAEYEDVLFTGSLDNSICSRDRLVIRNFLEISDCLEGKVVK